MNKYKKLYIDFCLAVLLAISVSAIQAQDASQYYEIQQINKQTIRTLFESLWNEKNFSVIENSWAPDVTFHISGQQHTVNREDLRNMVNSWYAAFPDFRFVVENIIAEDNHVAAQVNFSATHTGAKWFGLAPTGKSINVTEMMFFRFENGVVIEAWEVYDEYTMRRQLGAL